MFNYHIFKLKDTVGCQPRCKESSSPDLSHAQTHISGFLTHSCGRLRAIIPGADATCDEAGEPPSVLTGGARALQQRFSILSTLQHPSAS